eukprot:s465_g19.t2
MVDETLARYACWISSQAALASGMDQKLTALSRRTAAEFRKAEAEHADLATRIGLLEACCCRAGLMSSEVDVSFSKPVAGRGDEAGRHSLPEPLEQQCRGLVEASRFLSQLLKSACGGAMAEQARCSHGCALLAQFWGVGLWVYIFVDCIAVELGRGLQPFKRMDLTGLQWAGYATIAISLWLVEGVRAFQMSFSPMLVRRARELREDSPTWEKILAPFFVAGLVSATPGRLMKSWLLILILIPGLALSVPHLPYPWREAVDAGVVLGLGWGTAAVAYFWLRGWFGSSWPTISADLPAHRIKPTAEANRAPLAEGVV